MYDFIHKPFSPFDISIFLSYVLVLAILFWMYSSRYDRTSQRVFMSAFWAKVLFTLAFCALYWFYYKFGDTFAFFKFSQLIYTKFNGETLPIINFLFNGDFTTLHSGTVKDVHLDQRTFLFTLKVCTFINLFTFNSYLTTSFIFSLFSFLGFWRLYRVFLKLINTKFDLPVAVILFFFPSFGIWTSGILKDPLVASAVGFYIAFFISIFLLKEKVKWKWLYMIICVLVLNHTKSYVASALVASSLVYFFFVLLKKITNKFVKYSLYLFSAVAMAAMFLIFQASIQEMINDFVFQEIIAPALYQGNNLVVQGTSSENSTSTYSLGVDLFSITTFDLRVMIKLVPNAIFTTLYRPFPWEATKVFQFFSALENTIGFFITLYLIFKTGFIKFFRRIASSPYILSGFFFILVFAFLVGVASGNFGSLSRYRTPCIILFYILIYLVARFPDNKYLYKK